MRVRWRSHGSARATGAYLACRSEPPVARGEDASLRHRRFSRRGNPILSSRSCVMLANWASRVGGEPFEIFFLLVRSEKFICLSSFATVLRLTRMPKAESSAAIFFVVLRVHLRPLTGSPATSYFISSSIAAMTSGVFFRQLCGRHPLFGPAPHSHHAQVARDGPEPQC